MIRLGDRRPFDATLAVALDIDLQAIGILAAAFLAVFGNGMERPHSTDILDRFRR